MEQTAALALDSSKMGVWEWHEDKKKGQWSERTFAILGFPIEVEVPIARRLDRAGSSR